MTAVSVNRCDGAQRIGIHRPRSSSIMPNQKLPQGSGPRTDWANPARQQPHSSMAKPACMNLTGGLAESGNHWAGTNLAPASFPPEDLPNENFALANPRVFLEVNLQRSGRFAKSVGEFANANDAGVRFVQAQESTISQSANSSSLLDPRSETFKTALQGSN